MCCNKKKEKESNKIVDIHVRLTSHINILMVEIKNNHIYMNNLPGV